MDTNISKPEDDKPPPCEDKPPSKSWKWQIKNSITTLEQLRSIIDLTDDEVKAFEQIDLPFRLTPYFAEIVKKSSAIRKTMVPTIHELIKSPDEDEDPLDEEKQSPTRGIVHRYPDRVLFLSTTFCAANCRYCTRSRIVGGEERDEWEKSIDYIREHTEIRDVIISGGDPLTMSDEMLEILIKEIRSIPHVEVIRIGTKVPVVLPMRITDELVAMLKKYHPLYVNIHFTHPDEITEETTEACNKLADAGIPLGSQTVLLKGVNDDVATMKSLMQKLLKIRVRPYYIYHCDNIVGSKHFRTTVEDGVNIVKGLRGFTSGLAVPQYIVDLPHGGGKISISPDYYLGDNNFVNYKGEKFTLN
jgi:lysine 2,3-aminomutase